MSKTATADTSAPHVLFVTYYFPPSGGPGVQRVLKFAKYLPEFGFTPLVLTVPESAEYPVRDPSLVAEAPPASQVFRSPILEFYDAYRWITGARRATTASVDIRASSRTATGVGDRLARLMRGALFIPDGRVGWLPGGTRVGRRVLQTHAVRAIVASGPPFTAHWIGLRLARASGLPLILDFRDPWTRAPFYPSRPRWARRLDERLERRCLRGAHAVVTVNRAIRDDFVARLPEIPASRYHVIHNAYDEADFAGRAPQPAPIWTLAYTGSIMAAHVPHVLFEVIRAWVRDCPEMSERMRLRLAGRIDPEMARLLAEPPFDRLARYVGYLPHAQSIQELLDAHLLLLLIVRDAQAHGMVTGKVFEYLGSGTPILAIAPDGEAAEILREAGGSRVVAPDDAQGLRRALEEAFRAHQGGRRPFDPPHPEARRALTRRRATERLAEILRGVSGPRTDHAPHTVRAVPAAAPPRD